MSEERNKAVWPWIAALFIGLTTVLFLMPTVLFLAWPAGMPDIGPNSQTHAAPADWHPQTSGSFNLGYGNFEDIVSGKTVIVFDSERRPHLEDH